MFSDDCLDSNLRGVRSSAIKNPALGRVHFYPLSCDYEAVVVFRK
jgi:hypothetical protein